MLSPSRGHINADLEAQQVILPKADDNATTSKQMKPWRLIFVILRVRRQIRISIAGRAKKVFQPLITETSYTVINTNGIGDANIEPSEIEEIPPNPDISLDVSSTIHEDSNICCNIKLQHENIATIVKARDLDSLHKFGGVQGIAAALNADLRKGIPGDEETLNSRCRATASTLSSSSKASTRGFFQLLLKSSNSYIIFLLFVSAVLSLSFGIQEKGPDTGWHEGAFIISAIIILLVVPPLRDLLLENSKKLSGGQKLCDKRQMVVTVLREGIWLEASVCDVVMGDVVRLKRGCLVPGDGLFISGEYLKLDDRFAGIIDEHNPFLFYGAKVTNGHGDMLVTSTGMNTAWGEMMNNVMQVPNNAQLPAQLHKLNTCTQIVGLSTSILLLVLSFLRFKLGKQNEDPGLPDLKENRAEKDIMDLIKRIVWNPSGKISVLTTSLTLVLVGMVQGVPFVIALATSYWKKKIASSKEKACIQEQMACLTIGSVTTICTETTGGLTLNPQEVDMLLIGEEIINEDSVVSADVIEALCDGIYAKAQILGSPHGLVNDSVLTWAVSKLGMEMEILKQNYTIVETNGSSSGKEGSGVLMRKNGSNESNMCSHWTGPATIILEMCSCYYDMEGKIKGMDEEKRSVLKEVTKDRESNGLKTAAFAYKQTNAPMLEDGSLILIGLIGLKDTSWTKMKEAMVAFRNAGVNIILVSEDNVSVLEAIGLECGVLTGSDRLVLDGESFRNFSDEKRMDVVDKISVMGNSLPSDKLLLVRCLRQKDQVIAIVGVKRNEIPALKEADIGIAMGTWSSELARESSDVIMWDGNFSSLCNILRCGRCFYDNIQKYIQVELTITIAGLFISSMTTIIFGDTPITTIQMVWVNVIVAILGGLALLTEPPSEELMKKPPMRRTEPFITKAMWKNIITQASYQATIMVAFQFKGQAILKINKDVNKSTVFNSLVLCQVFNLFNARRQEMNLLKISQQNPWFWVALVVTLMLQLAFIEISHFIFGLARLDGAEWGICFVIGMISCAADVTLKIASGIISRSLAWSSGTNNLELPLSNINTRSTSSSVD